MHLAWKRIPSTTSKKISWRVIVTKHFELPNGKTYEYGTVTPEGTQPVSIIALTPDNKVVLARQFRPGPELVMDELPGGGSNDKADVGLEASVKRELMEETGYGVGDIEYLGYDYRDGYSNAKHHYFLATGCTIRGPQQLDETEFIEVKLVTIKQLIKNAKAGLMTDAAGVLMAYDRLLALESES